MDEKRNRFIIFPEEPTVSEQIDTALKEENMEEVVSISSNDSLENYLGQVSLIEEDNEKNETVDVEIPVISVSDIEQNKIGENKENFDCTSSKEEDGLSDLSSIIKDDDGRIIFDTPSTQNVEIIEKNSDSFLENKSDLIYEEDYINDNSKDVSFVDESSSFIGSEDESVYDENISTESQHNAFQSNRSLQDMINKILKVDQLNPVEVDIPTEEDKKAKEEAEKIAVEKAQKQEAERTFRQEIYDVVQGDLRPVIFKSDLLNKIQERNQQTGAFSILTRYGEDYCSKDFVTNPAIGRDEEIKQLILTLLTPEKSAILIGKPGIGKTSIVEGLAYRLQRGIVPEALQGFAIINIKTPSLLGTLPTGETRLQTLVDELKQLDHVILFIDEIHMLIGATSDSALDFANMFKEGLGRGQIKVIGATTTEEYERYILRDKAFVRRFQSIDVQEPSREHTIKILMGTLPKIEKDTHAKMKYTTFIQSEIMAFITDITSEYKRIYGIGSRYPDICLTLVKEAFSQCIFDNRDEVTIFDVRDAIENSKNIYPDVIRKELPKFDEKFKKIIDEERMADASVDRL